MKVGSLFAGIGGFDLGLERAGMTIKWQVENDPFCNRVLAKHWPGVRRFGDIRDCGSHNLPAVDLICGGFPCQPYSIAGKRKGQADDRHLWPEMFRVISELRPAWVLCENVTEIDGVALDDCLSDLEAAGYETAPPLEIPACAVNAPHIRQRVWIVAYAQCFRTSGRQFGGPQQIDKTNESELRRENWWGQDAPNPDQETYQDFIQAQYHSSKRPEYGRIFPTPSANDSRGGGRKAPGQMNLHHLIKNQTGGTLNPTWVEWLMGFPLGWTDLEV